MAIAWFGEPTLDIGTTVERLRQMGVAFEIADDRFIWAWDHSTVSEGEATNVVRLIQQHSQQIKRYLLFLRAQRLQMAERWLGVIDHHKELALRDKVREGKMGGAQDG